MNNLSYNRIHFIAVGGSVMHNLALALNQKGLLISGSDDEIYEPAKSKLENSSVSVNVGWDPSVVSDEIDAVILGMHAKEDNPELQRALELNIPVFSFPDFIFEMSKTKKRIVVGGSHGKSSITSMIMHVLAYHQIDFDYLVGAELEGFELTVKLGDAPVIVIEGDEYLSSRIDPTPKFLKYHHDIGIITGISWDHKNVFPTFSLYKEQFIQFAKQTPKEGKLIYYSGDDEVTSIINDLEEEIPLESYSALESSIEDGVTFAKFQAKDVQLQIFGEHNLQNLSAALKVCLQLGLPEEDFFKAIETFKGAGKRLEKIEESTNRVVFKDYAHSPSKLKATLEALGNQYPKRKILAAYELHTFSSLDSEFIEEYRDTANSADEFLVFVNGANLKLKQNFNLDQQQLRDKFNRPDLLFFTDIELLKAYIIDSTARVEEFCLAFLSSGNFAKTDLKLFSKELI